MLWCSQHFVSKRLQFPFVNGILARHIFGSGFSWIRVTENLDGSGFVTGLQSICRPNQFKEAVVGSRRQEPSKPLTVEIASVSAHISRQIHEAVQHPLPPRMLKVDLELVALDLGHLAVAELGVEDALAH